MPISSTAMHHPAGNLMKGEMLGNAVCCI